MEHQERKKKEYQDKVKKKMPKSNTFMECVRAFLVGGLICCFGHFISDLGRLWLRLDIEDSALFTSIVLVFLAALLTGIGVYDKIGKFAGAGSIVPITGFSNSIVSPAMEFKREGYVQGVGVKLFTIAGPVLVYGISTSIVVGIITFLFFR
ncbi:MAG: SpoVA protein [Firmicutes bacterium ADurb.Bin182]|nr:MAG: SpoVA protein [Firmicutes bacterium ADurb.Bin182]